MIPFLKMEPLSVRLLPVLLFVSASSFAAEPDKDGYRLVWADEFEKDGQPNPAKWTYEQGFVRNNELQWYQPENASCSNGLLVIEAKRERKANPGFEPESRDWRRSRREIEYTSACLITRGLQSWQYGRFEIRARIQARKGLWPAIWFLGVEGRWPYNGEIDLMEFYGGEILANACWGGEQRNVPVWDTVRKPVASFEDPEWDREFHVWRMEWDENRIALYVDNLLLNTIDQHAAVNPKGLNGPEYPFRQPHYLLINLAIGGSNGGDPADTPFPARFEVDYVRVYRRVEADEN